MTKIALLFPGQGSQKIGMGLDFYDNFDDSKQLFDAGCQAIGEHLKTICFEGPSEELKLTQNAQPLIFLVSIMIYKQLKNEGIIPSYVAGHSLGELTAYYASNVLSFEDTLDVIRFRGLSMAESYPSDDSAMCAVMGLEDDLIKSIVSSVDVQPVVAANFNCPGQVVISGVKKAVEEAKLQLKEKAAKCIDLPVSGAFHSPLMNSASDRLSGHINNLSFFDSDIPIILNRLAEPVSSAKLLKTNIPEQVKSSVRWTDSIRFLDDNVDIFVECGPGRVLSGLVKKISSKPIYSVNSVESLEKFVKEIKQLQLT